MDIKESRILTHSHPTNDRRRRHRWAAAAIGGFSLLGMVAAFAIAPSAKDATVKLTAVLEKLPAPSITLLDTGSTVFLREERVRRSDTIASLMHRLGIYDGEALNFIRSDPQARDMARHLQPGSTVSARAGAWGELHSLYVELPGKDALLVVERSGDGFVAHGQALQLESRTVVKSGEIHHSLFGATDDADIPDAIAMQMVAIFGSEVDFHRDLRKGDRFSLVYEALTYRGQAVRSGRILAAELVNDQKVLQAYWFQPEQGEGAYHAADGSSLRKAFLRSPIEFSRISSGFSGARFHPILRTWRAHKGVDYAARAGTGILAVADGVVETAARERGYGNLIVLKHQGSYSTAYGHLKNFAPGIRKGARVRQGDTIGYVGQTGLATGPHLHYEFRVKDKPVDPLAIALPTAVPLDKAHLASFRASSEKQRRQLAMAREISLASAE
ncbi:peptidoglycan DD-metalloendopeptidase family protein [Accumulibacter sp.]|jgi:murein DD-endopeptidase MepM/ murein hydrolase activator NlpD|nr:peptidoglycan DD-metalloendopeptidase family protein [Accumulibacter sp.]HRE70993.1 peptidoglycan DD-metalloendopeptidase family protein [Accumulibacter sp.]